MTAMPVTGLSLKLRRVSADVKSSALAERMGVSSSTVSRLEGSRTVPEPKAVAYLDALATFPAVVSLSEPQEAA